MNTHRKSTIIPRSLSASFRRGLKAMALRRFEEAENLFTALLRHHHDAMQWANKAHCEAIRKLRAEEEQQ